MPVKVEADVLQVGPRGSQEIMQRRYLCRVAGTHRYSRVQASAIYQPGDKISYNKYQWLEQEASILDLSKQKVHLAIKALSKTFQFHFCIALRSLLTYKQIEKYVFNAFRGSKN